jgi:hypothetical protein
MDLGPRSTLAFVAFSLCKYESVPGGSIIPPDELKQFLIAKLAVLNELAIQLGIARQDIDARSREIDRFFS